MESIAEPKTKKKKTINEDESSVSFESNDKIAGSLEIGPK